MLIDEKQKRLVVIQNVLHHPILIFGTAPAPIRSRPVRKISGQQS